jgi:hypothetical protein
VTITAPVPLFVLLVGAIIWAAAPWPKLEEAGRIAFAVGLLVAVAVWAGATVHLP